jgi:hypothetical protein
MKEYRINKTDNGYRIQIQDPDDLQWRSLDENGMVPDDQDLNTQYYNTLNEARRAFRNKIEGKNYSVKS